MVDLANNDTAVAHFDDLAEAGEAEREMISSRVSDMWKDKAVICQVIEENLDTINHINQAAFDVTGDIEKLIDGCFETMVRDELNL